MVKFKVWGKFFLPLRFSQPSPTPAGSEQPMEVGPACPPSCHPQVPIQGFNSFLSPCTHLSPTSHLSLCEESPDVGVRPSLTGPAPPLPQFQGDSPRSSRNAPLGLGLCPSNQGEKPPSPNPTKMSRVDQLHGGATPPEPTREFS